MREDVLASKACHQKHTVCVKDGQTESFKLVITGEVEIPQKASGQIEDGIDKIRARRDGKRSDIEINKTNDEVGSL